MGAGSLGRLHAVTVGTKGAFHQQFQEHVTRNLGRDKTMTGYKTSRAALKSPHTPLTNTLNHVYQMKTTRSSYIGTRSKLLWTDCTSGRPLDASFRDVLTSSQESPQAPSTSHCASTFFLPASSATTQEKHASCLKDDCPTTV